MKTKWTKNLLAECRNREVIVWRKMSVMARVALDDLHYNEPKRVEYYGEAGWHPIANEPKAWRCVPSTAYRIIPGWNPMEKKGGAI